MENLIKEVVSQGGWAALAGLLAFLGYKVYQQAQGVLVRVLDLVERAAGAQAALTAAVESLRDEFAGLRTGVHGVRNLMVRFEERLRNLEKRP